MRLSVFLVFAWSVAPASGQGFGSYWGVMRLACVGDDVLVARWNGAVECVSVADGARRWSRWLHHSWIDALAIGPPGSNIAATAEEDREENSRIIVWDYRDGSMIRELRAGIAAYDLALPSRDQTIVACGLRDYEGVVVEIAPGQEPRKMGGVETTMIARIRTVPEEHMVIGGTEGGNVFRIDLAKEEPSALVTQTKGNDLDRVEAIASGRTGDTVAVGTFAGSLAVVDWASGVVTGHARLGAAGLGIRDICRLGDSVVACLGDELVVADLSESTLEVRQRITSPSGQINACDVSVRAMAIIAGHNDGTLTKWPIMVHRRRVRLLGDFTELRPPKRPAASQPAAQTQPSSREADGCRQ